MLFVHIFATTSHAACTGITEEQYKTKVKQLLS
jgi:hypothetical protein